MKKVVEGSYAAAKAVQLCKPGVIAVYPITPQTHIPEKLAKMIADGELGSEMVRVESEHSAIAACIGSQATGVRSYTATSSQGLALMHEMLYIASGLRLPIVMTNVNRALSAPINIWCFSKEAEVLMRDLSYKPINKIKLGDEVLGKDKGGNLRFTKVKRVFRRTVNNLIKIKTDEFELICTPDHEFYHRPGHRHWTQAKNLKYKKLHWFGYGFEENKNFKKGWLAGMADGDGCFFRDRLNRFSFTLKMKDREAITRFIKWSNEFGFGLREIKYYRKYGLFCVRLTKNEETRKFQKFLEKSKNRDFYRGYVAGMYDSEGSGPFKVKQAVLYNSNRSIVDFIATSLKELDISFKIYTDKRREGKYKRDNYHIKINNVPEFFIKCRPVIKRKRENLTRMTLKSVKSRLKVNDLIPIKGAREVYNLETGTNNYIVNGLLVHNCDQQDSFGARDSGWIQLYCENAQEIFDTHIQAFRIAEETLLPVMVCLDGYILSHTSEPVEFLDAEKVAKFLPKYKPVVSLNPAKPATMGSLGTPEHFIHFKKQQDEAMEKALEVIRTVNREYSSVSGRLYGNGLIETIELEGKDSAIITLGSVVGTARALLEKMGIGLIKLKALRPLPAEELRKACQGLKSVGVLEKDISLGANGALYNEVRSVLYDLEAGPKVSGFIAGLGGRDISLKDMESVMRKIRCRDGKPAKEGVEWLM